MHNIIMECWADVLVIAYVILFVGALLLFQPVDSYLDTVPYLSTFHISSGVWLVAIMTSLPVWIAMIALSWSSARRLLAVLTLVIDAAVVVIIALVA
jgi:hypothetical protein